MQATITAANDRPCRKDIEQFCADIRPGDGRMAKCLRSHHGELSPECRARGKEILESAHEACHADVTKYCKEVKPGEGRILACRKDHDKDLPTGCKTA